jgi:response regulator RpfG family c-di-GMP phosphodiesterase
MMKYMSFKPVMMAIDDNPVNLQLLVEGLGDKFEVVCCTGGEEALQLVEACIPDLILLDIQMPGMSGYEVCQRLKSMATVKDVPVIFLTAMSQLDDEIKGLEYGAVDYITKPFDMRIVRLRAGTQLELRRSKRLLEERTQQLEQTLHDLRTLQEIIPICMHCKKIRDDVGAWNRLEDYISRHTGSNFSHGICPDCLREYYGDDIADKLAEKKRLQAEQNGQMCSDDRI